MKLDRLIKELQENVDGDIHFDTLTKKIYSVDASIYEVEPVGIVIPKSKEALYKTLEIAQQHHIPVIARGAATGITGGCLGRGLIVDTSKYLNKILEINIEEEYAICEPGVVQDRLNEALAPYGYRLGPDTSTGNRATLGGMLANNSAGARSLLYGTMCDHTLEVELALVGGTALTCRSISIEELEEKMALKTKEGEIYRTVVEEIEKNQTFIEKHFPNIPRHVSGYSLDKLLHASTFNLSKIIAGSEGTLGIATSIKVRIAKKPKHTGIALLHIDNMEAGLKEVEKMLKFSPISLEMIDRKILEAARLSPTAKTKLSWLKGDPEAVFVAEFAGDSPEAVDVKLDQFHYAINNDTIQFTDPEKMGEVWEVRKAGLGLLLSKRSYSRAIAFIEDLSVPPEKLSGFITEFRQLLRSYNKDAGIYGHIGSGCMHIRPYINLNEESELQLMQEMIVKISDLILKYGGAMSGEHGDGLVRSWLNEKIFGKEVYEAFRKIKMAFDPHQLMNPHKIVDGPPLTENLRLNPTLPEKHLETFLDFTEEGGLSLAADMCNGNGQCRKMEGVMCPSFQATHDEFDTTRARAQTLRSIIHGRLEGDLSATELHEVMDLCLECKGCKRECPSQVDMAKMKSETLYHYQEKHGYPLRNKIFAHLHLLTKSASKFPKIYNWITQSTFGKFLLGKCGISAKRELPQQATETFSTWFKNQPQISSSKKVALFNDTYTEYNRPEVGRAAFHVLQAMGYEIQLIQGVCCGRPLISKGFLREAKANAGVVICSLEPFLKEEMDIITLEPSCSSALTDDFRGLVAKDPELYLLWKQMTHKIKTFEEFMALGIDPKLFTPLNCKVWIHTHCHQKALQQSQFMTKIINRINLGVTKEIPTGCCGLAGSFGYEAEHYELSMKVGSLHLFPLLSDMSNKDLLIANGFSCSSQIFHGTKRESLHLAELLADQLKTS